MILNHQNNKKINKSKVHALYIQEWVWDCTVHTHDMNILSKVLFIQQILFIFENVGAFEDQTLLFFEGDLSYHNCIHVPVHVHVCYSWESSQFFPSIFTQ